jgi:energy-dependent translational throttle protein EttA
MGGVRGQGQVVWYEGNYREYEADKKYRLGAAADIPHAFLSH